ncbi:MAG: hypothetical protein Q7T03_10555 [Deltaproteobacteria bacterium]|nr:hypothetical protein [Deltaproteobacteria bacterium]
MGTIHLFGSERHREAWNLQADEMKVPLHWVQDKGKLHHIDIEAGDLEISAEARAKFGLTPGGPVIKTPALWKAVGEVNAALEAARQNLLKESLSRRKHVESKVSINHLTPGEKKLADFVLKKLGPLVDRYHLVSTDPRFPEWQKRIASEEAVGDALSAEQWRHKLDDQCFDDDKDVRCSVFDDFPNKRPKFNGQQIGTLIPSDLTQKDIDWMENAWKGEKLRNPFFSSHTVVEHDGDGGFKWTPASVHPITAGTSKELSQAFLEAAAIEGIESSLSQELMAWGKALQSRDPYPFDDAERATIWQNEGNLEISVDVSPDGLLGKSGIQMLAGVIRPGEATYANEKVRPILQSRENRLGQLLPDIYKSRTIRQDTPVRFMDLFFRDASAQQNVRGELMAYAFPSGTKVSQEEGVAKRIVAVNHMVLKFDNIYRLLAEVAMHPTQVPFVTQRGVELFAVVHEMSHGFGPQSSTQTAAGKSVELALGGGLNYGLEEAKADSGGMDSVPTLFGREALVESDTEQVYATYVTGLIRQIYMGGRGHGAIAPSSFGLLCGEGAIIVKDNHFYAVLEKMPAALEKLWATISSLQMKGDPEAAKIYMDEEAKKIPPLMDELVAKFNSLNFPNDIKIEYEFVETP